MAYEETGTKEDVKEWLSWAQTTAMTVPDGSVYVPEDSKTNEKRIFSHPLSYKKGALIIHMIRYILDNDELFYNILQEFQSRYTDSTASGEDFKNIVEEISHIDFDRFFEQWFYGEGFPTLQISWEQYHDSVFIYVDQSVSAPDITPFFDITMDFILEYFDGDSLIKLTLDMPIQKISFPFKKKIYNIVADPDLWIFKGLNGVHRILPDDKHAYYSIFPNPASIEVFIENIEIGKPFLIKIYDIKGVLRFETQGYDNFTCINLEKFESGMYQIVIYKDDSQETYQLVKT